MLKTKRPGFSIKDEFVVHPSRDLKYGGEIFERGHIFPWKKVGCTPRRLNLMFDARKIITKEELDAVFERAKLLELNTPEISQDKEVSQDEDQAPRAKRRLNKSDDSKSSKRSKRRLNKSDDSNSSKRSKRELPKPRS